MLTKRECPGNFFPYMEPLNYYSYVDLGKLCYASFIKPQTDYILMRTIQQYYRLL